MIVYTVWVVKTLLPGCITGMSGFSLPSRLLCSVYKRECLGVWVLSLQVADSLERWANSEFGALNKNKNKNLWIGEQCHSVTVIASHCYTLQWNYIHRRPLGCVKGSRQPPPNCQIQRKQNIENLTSTNLRPLWKIHCQLIHAGWGCSTNPTPPLNGVLQGGSCVPGMTELSFCKFLRFFFTLLSKNNSILIWALWRRPISYLLLENIRAGSGCSANIFHG